MKIENLIRDKYKNLNETEKEILRYIISNSNKIRGLRIKDLADAVFCTLPVYYMYIYNLIK